MRSARAVSPAAVAWSGDGHWLAVHDEPDVIRLLERSDEQSVREQLRVKVDLAIHALALSHDAVWLAAGGAGQLVLWRIEAVNGQRRIDEVSRGRLPGDGNTRIELAFARDAASLAVAHGAEVLLLRLDPEALRPKLRTSMLNINADDNIQRWDFVLDTPAGALTLRQKAPTELDADTVMSMLRPALVVVDPKSDMATPVERLDAALISVRNQLLPSGLGESQAMSRTDNALVLGVGRALAAYPWELLLTGRDSAPLGVTHGLVRRSRGEAPAFTPAPASAPLHALFVSTGGFGSTAHSNAEFDHAQATRLAETLGDAWGAPQGVIELAFGTSPGDVIQSLVARHWRLLVIVGTPTAEGHLALDDNVALGWREVQAMRHVPDVVMLFGGDFRRQAEPLRRIGVAVVVVAGWPMDTESLWCFFSEFVRVLRAGDPLIRATQMARQYARSRSSGSAWALQVHGDALWTWPKVSVWHDPVPNGQKPAAQPTIPTQAAEVLGMAKRDEAIQMNFDNSEQLMVRYPQAMVQSTPPAKEPSSAPLEEEVSVNAFERVFLSSARAPLEEEDGVNASKRIFLSSPSEYDHYADLLQTALEQDLNVDRATGGSATGKSASAIGAYVERADAVVAIVGKAGRRRSNAEIRLAKNLDTPVIPVRVSYDLEESGELRDIAVANVDARGQVVALNGLDGAALTRAVNSTAVNILRTMGVDTAPFLRELQDTYEDTESRYFDPPGKVKSLGRRLHEGDFRALVSQLAPDEVLMGLYENQARALVATHVPSRVRLHQLSEANLTPLGFYAMRREAANRGWDRVTPVLAKEATRPMVVVSYVRSYFALAQALVSALEATGRLDVRWDGNLSSDESFPDTVLQWVARSDALVALIGPASAQAKYSKVELERAQELGKPVVPVVVEAGELPSALASYQAVNVDKDGSLLLLAHLKGRSLQAALSLAAFQVVEAVTEVLSGARQRSVSGSRLSVAGVRKRMVEGGDLVGADLRRLNLSQMDLTGANLRGANLVSTDLSRANLKNANLDAANLERATLDGANLSGTVLSRANLWRASMRGVRNLSAVATLEDANLFSTQGLRLPQSLKSKYRVHQFESYPAFLGYFESTKRNAVQLREVFLWLSHADEGPNIHYVGQQPGQN